MSKKTNPIGESSLNILKSVIHSNPQISPVIRTGFPILDYMLGYDSRQSDGPTIGMTMGTVNMIIGHTSTGKTTFCIGLAANLVRPYTMGNVYHLDAENSTIIPRIRNLTGFSEEDLENGKYNLIKDKKTYQDVYDLIVEIYKMKTSNSSMFEMTMEQDNKKIHTLQPTIIIMDSIPGFSAVSISEEDLSTKELGGRTEAATAGLILKQFINRIQSLLMKANITILAINHIQEKIEMNAFSHSPAEIPHLRQNEHIPGGGYLKYLTNSLITVRSSNEKFIPEKDGFRGFGSKITIVKSRSSSAGMTMNAIFDSITGMDVLRTNLRYLEEKKLIGGSRRDRRYFIDDDSMVFSMNSPYESFNENPLLYKKMYEIMKPLLVKDFIEVSPEIYSRHDISDLYNY